MCSQNQQGTSKTNLSLRETKQWLPEAVIQQKPQLWKNAQSLNHEEANTFYHLTIHLEESVIIETP